jgi:hypothetical protein
MMQETGEKVQQLMQLADGLIEKGHTYAANIKSLVSAVEAEHKTLCSHMTKFRDRLNSNAGLNNTVSYYNAASIYEVM